MLDRAEALRGFVIEKSDASDADLATYMHHARALLFPSFVEGYGLPLVEALAAGTPVIASDIPVFRELAGDLPTYADPLDAHRWLALLRKAAYTARASSEDLQYFRAPSWRAHFEKVDELLRTLP
jgi:glycosyltransferase involved in cell wall biosynthesis